MDAAAQKSFFPVEVCVIEWFQSPFPVEVCVIEWFKKEVHPDIKLALVEAVK